ncbi:hypothetical protein [Leifsonia poae]|uniref:hypothetical protein n=1 Tax=Leifsonia poae TaxID=110933 RepID=UPI003D677098
MSDRADPPPPRVDDAAGAGWTYATIAYLQQEARCPRCLSGRMDGSVCQTCFADLRGEWGGRMREASAAVVAALRNRQQTVLSLPTLPSAGAPSVAQTVPEAYHLPVTAAELARQTARAAQQTAPPEQQVSVQSVLAVTGAALLAVAAIVFTFLNPDLTDVGARTAIVAGVAVLFLSGGWLLARRSLRFSAETIGALGIVFAVLAGWALAAIVPDGVMTRLGAATATLVLSSLAVIAATRVRMRTWLWCGLVGIGITPAIAASAWSSPWSAILGSLGCAFSALLVLALIRRLEPGFRRPLAADRVTATILQLTALTVMLSVLVGLSGRSDSVPFAPVLVVAASAVLAALTAREFIPGFWSVAAGALAVAAAAAVPVQFDLGSESVYWIVALAPLAATAALVALTILPSMGALQRSRMLGGAWTLARATAIPAVLMLLVELLTTFRPVAGLGTDPWFGVSVVAALTITAGGSFALVRIARPLSVKNEAVFGASIAVVALHAIAACAWFAEPVRAAVALVLAAGLVAALSKRGPLRTVSARIRLPLILGSHTLLFYAAVVAWSTPWSQVAVSAGVVAALALLATIVPRTFRPVYVAAGFLYGLIVLGTALGLTGLDPTANLCITTSVGVLTAIAATMAKGMSFDTWVAVLASATIPFLVTVAMVIVARSGWTALPTAFTFVLALTIVLDRRERLHRTLRGVAAAALVPSLAVVIITLGAQILSGSASPVTLPIIAAIVAVAVPATRRIGALLAARGMPADHVAAVRLWIEVSGLVTGAIAILLAVIRVAAGAQTALLVFLILGVGAAATSLVARRSYGWWAAGACWTGALWSTLVLLGITSVELYLLPPAIVAVAIGAIAVGRGRRALPCSPSVSLARSRPASCF